MNQINILVIDDETSYVERLMDTLRRKDFKKQIGQIIVDNSMLGDQSLEQYDAFMHKIKFDIVLIDYQLGCSYTGILVSAWMMLQLRVPRMTLTSGAYPGPKDYFDGHITKDEIIDNTEDVISRIISCVETFNYNAWLENQYEQLVGQYSELITDEQNLDTYDKENLDPLIKLLDKFEKIIDAEQEEKVKLKMEYIKNNYSFIQKEKKFESEILDKKKNLQETLRKLKRYYE